MPSALLGVLVGDDGVHAVPGPASCPMGVLLPLCQAVAYGYNLRGGTSMMPCRVTTSAACSGRFGMPTSSSGGFRPWRLPPCQNPPSFRRCPRPRVAHDRGRDPSTGRGSDPGHGRARHHRRRGRADSDPRRAPEGPRRRPPRCAWSSSTASRWEWSPTRGKNPDAIRCHQWARDLWAAGVRVLVPEICDYEVRRKLIHVGSTSGIARLDRLKIGYDYAPITTDVMQLAAELWAQARRRGLPRHRPMRSTADVILAAKAILAAGPGRRRDDRHGQRGSSRPVP